MWWSRGAALWFQSCVSPRRRRHLVNEISCRLAWSRANPRSRRWPAADDHRQLWPRYTSCPRSFTGEISSWRRPKRRRRALPAITGSAPYPSTHGKQAKSPCRRQGLVFPTDGQRWCTRSADVRRLAADDDALLLIGKAISGRIYGGYDVSRPRENERLPYVHERKMRGCRNWCWRCWCWWWCWF